MDLGCEPGKTTGNSDTGPQPPPNWACFLTFQKGGPSSSRGLHDPTSRRGTERAREGRQAGREVRMRRPCGGVRRVRLEGVCKTSGSVTHYSKGLAPSRREVRKLSWRPGWSQPAAPRLQGAGQCRLSGQGPRPRQAAPGDPGGGPTRGPCPSPAPWSASPAAGASASAPVFKPPAGCHGANSEIGPPPRARAAGSGRMPEAPPERACSPAGKGLLSSP